MERRFFQRPTCLRRFMRPVVLLMIGVFSSLAPAIPIGGTYALEVVVQTAGGPTDPQPQQPARFSYIKRGKQITQGYEDYTAQLAAFHNTLRLQVEAHAPELLPKLTKEPPQPVPYGYQLVPKLVHSPPPASVPPSIVSTAYSWPRTERMLTKEHRLLRALEEQLGNGVSTSSGTPQPDFYDRLVHDYHEREKAQRLIDRHIKHNRFWQNEIHQDKIRYDRQTALKDAVLERQRIQEALKAPPPPDQVGVLLKNEQELEDYIHTHRTSEPAAPFIRVEQRGPRVWIFHVPLYSDIQDLKFLQACKETIENGWHITTPDEEFRVEVHLQPINPVELYLPDAMPATGSHLDPRTHVARFPDGRGVLTTGAKSTHAIPRRAVILGPHEIGTNTLLHEFGHILGFTDRYVRGYRDLGEEGYEIFEVVPDYADIMASPGIGKVQLEHFEQLRTGFSENQAHGLPVGP